ncbi:MAG: hypothetical protein ACJ74Q_01365 [Pyrinomonadaceae bacterium]
MFLGDIVTITGNGIIVREKALQPLGIYDQSICWGVWAANPHLSHRTHGHPNLIISPFHPSSWPFLIRMRLVLENTQGVLARASRLLEQNDLSIVFAECTPTGFTHATWTVIAESTRPELDDLRVAKEQFDRENPAVRIPRTPPDGGAYDQARALANRIAARMLSHVRHLEDVFEEVCKEQKERGTWKNEPPLLHVWRAEGNSHFLYNGDAVAAEMDEMDETPKEGQTQSNMDYIRSHLPRPAEVSYIQRLAYFSLYGGGTFEEVPFRFRYRANATRIELERGTPFGEGSFKLSPLPMPAIGTFNSEDKYLRLCPVTPSFLARPLTRILVEYEVRQNAHNAKASQGLLRRICQALRDDVDLLHISNKWTRHGYANEKGEISFIADVEPAVHGELEARLKTVNADGPDRLEAVTIKDALVYKYALKKLFLSFHFGHAREGCIRQLVERAALDEGFINVVVETYTESVTLAVDNQIGSCQAFLQLIYSDKDDPYEMNLQWLQHEYSTACARAIPALRLVDTSRFSYERWRSRLVVNADHPLRHFRLDVSDAALGKVIREAVRELAKKAGIAQ